MHSSLIAASNSLTFCGWWAAGLLKNQGPKNKIKNENVQDELYNSNNKQTFNSTNFIQFSSRKNQFAEKDSCNSDFMWLKSSNKVKNKTYTFWELYEIIHSDIENICFSHLRFQIGYILLKRSVTFSNPSLTHYGTSLTVPLSKRTGIVWMGSL